MLRAFQNQRQFSKLSLRTLFTDSHADAGHAEQLEQIRRKDERVIGRFKENPSAFCNINPAEIEWRDEPAQTGGAYSATYFSAYLKNDAKKLIYHTPFSIGSYIVVGPEGNLGRTNFKTQLPLDDPTQAAYEVVLTGKPLLQDEGRNEMFYEYLQWLSQIELGLAKMLASNVNEFPVLKKKLARVDKNMYEKTILDSLQTVKIKFDQHQNVIENSENIKFKSKMYNRNASLYKKQFESEEEERIFNEHGLQKFKLKLYDAKGERLNEFIKTGSVVSLCSCFNASLTDTPISASGILLRRPILSVTQYRGPFTTTSSDMPDGPQSPFGSLVD